MGRGELINNNNINKDQNYDSSLEKCGGGVVRGVWGHKGIEVLIISHICLSPREFGRKFLNPVFLSF
jgi:hypothetical protein